MASLCSALLLILRSTHLGDDVDDYLDDDDVDAGCSIGGNDADSWKILRLSPHLFSPQSSPWEQATNQPKYQNLSKPINQSVD